MNLFSRVKLAFLLLLFLVSCKAQIPSIPTQTSSPPTITPDSGIITPKNAGRLVPINQIGMGAAIGSPLFSTDGKWLYQATTSGVFVFDTTSYAHGRLLSPFSTVEYEDQMMDLSPDGKTLAIGNDLIDTNTGQKISSLDVPWPGTRAVKFSPDGTLLARGYNLDPSGGVSRVGVWRMSDGSLLHTVDAKIVGELGFSTDGNYLSMRPGFSGTSALNVYDLRTGDLMTNWTGNRSSFLPGNQLALESSDSTIRIYDLETGMVRHVFYGAFPSASPDGKLIAMQYFDSFKVNRLADEQVLASIPAHPTRNFGAVLRISPDGQTLAVYTADYCCGSHSDTLSIWRIADSTLIKKLDSPSDLFNFSPDGKSLAVTVRNDSTRIINTEDGSLRATAGAYNLSAIAVAFLPEGNPLVVAGLEDTTGHGYAYKPPLFFYDMKSGNLVNHESAKARNVPPAPVAVEERYVSGQHLMSGGCCVAYSPDGKLAAGGSYDSFNIVDRSTNTVLHAVSDLPEHIASLSFSPDGKRLAVAFLMDVIGRGPADFPGIALWDVPSGKMIEELDTVHGVSSVDYSPDGRFLAAGGVGGVVVWNASDGSLRFPIGASVASLDIEVGHVVSPLAFSPDGRILATGSLDGTVELWDTEKGEKLYSKKLTYGPCVIWSLNFSPDGKLLAAGFDDGGVRIFGIQ